MIKYNWEKNINEKELINVSKILKKDGIVIFPTETVYGIGGNANSKIAIDKIYKAKNRPREKAINIMVHDKEEIKKYAYIKNDLERKIIDNFMPGEITIILDKNEKFGEGFTKEKTIGIRIPSSKIALEILKNTKLPLIVPSANISGKPSGVDPKVIEKDFEKTVDIFIDGGILKGIPSTIVRIENGEIKVLREGKIKKEDILSIIE